MKYQSSSLSSAIEASQNVIDAIWKVLSGLYANLALANYRTIQYRG